MREITLKPYEKYSLEEKKFFVVEEGKILTKSILSNGEIINNNICLGKGEILFNFFEFIKDMDSLDIEYEIEALESTILKEIIFEEKDSNNKFYKNILEQLIKKSVIELKYQICSTPEYILMMLKLYSNKYGEIDKKILRPEYFNIGKTQFYKIYKDLKMKNFFYERNKKVYLNL